jgi:hypothetical protein
MHGLYGVGMVSKQREAAFVKVGGLAARPLVASHKSNHNK